MKGLTLFELGSSFVDFITSLVTLFELIAGKGEEEDEGKYIVLLVVCSFFGLVRLIADSVNLYYFGDNLPEGAPYGDLVGVYGEDLCGICIQLMQGPTRMTTFGIVQGWYKTLKFTYTAAKIMFTIAAAGEQHVQSGDSQEGADQVIMLLKAVGLSGFYCAGMFMYQSTKSSGPGNNVFLGFFVVYGLCAALHTMMFPALTPQYIAHVRG